MFGGVILTVLFIFSVNFSRVQLFPSIIEDKKKGKGKSNS